MLIIISSLFLPTNMDMKKQINMYLFMPMIFILIEIKFDININNDELLIIKQKRNKKKIINNTA
jgi:hypothetical protein